MEEAQLRAYENWCCGTGLVGRKEDDPHFQETPIKSHVAGSIYPVCLLHKPLSTCHQAPKQDGVSASSRVSFKGESLEQIDVRLLSPLLLSLLLLLLLLLLPSSLLSQHGLLLLVL